jgi:hypothetical protein
MSWRAFAAQIGPQTLKAIKRPLWDDQPMAWLLLDRKAVRFIAFGFIQVPQRRRVPRFWIGRSVAMEDVNCAGLFSSRASDSCV